MNSPPDKKDVIDLEDQIDALRSSSRLEIIHLLSQVDWMHQQTLLDHLGIGAPALSHHLRRLRSAGMVEMMKDGKQVMYRLERERVRMVLRAVEGLIGEAATQTGDSNAKVE